MEIDKECIVNGSGDVRTHSTSPCWLITVWGDTEHWVFTLHVSDYLGLDKSFQRQGCILARRGKLRPLLRNIIHVRHSRKVGAFMEGL